MKKIIYKKILDIVPENIRNKFEIFNFELPFIYNDGLETEECLCGGIYSIYLDLKDKILKHTGYIENEYKYLIDNDIEEEKDIIDLLELSEESVQGRKFINIDKLIKEITETVKINDYYDYKDIYFVPYVGINIKRSKLNEILDNDYDDDYTDPEKIETIYCNEIDDFENLCFRVRITRKNKDEIFINKIKEIDEIANQRLAIVNEDKKRKFYNLQFSQIKFFSENYEKYKTYIDLVAEKIQKKEISEDDLIKFGNIGECALIKIKNNLQ